MPSLQSLRRQIGSVKSTQKITKAMKMVAAAKLKRAQYRILAGKPYAHQLREVMGTLRERVNCAFYPFLQRRDGNKTELLVVPSDRGSEGLLLTPIFYGRLWSFWRTRLDRGNRCRSVWPGGNLLIFSDDAIGRFVSNGEASSIGSVLSMPWISGKTLFPNTMKGPSISCMWSITNLNQSCSSR